MAQKLLLISTICLFFLLKINPCAYSQEYNSLSCAEKYEIEKIEKNAIEILSSYDKYHMFVDSKKHTHPEIFTEKRAEEFKKLKEKDIYVFKLNDIIKKSENEAILYILDETSLYLDRVQRIVVVKLLKNYNREWEVGDKKVLIP
ncbi:MAG: hypothetical protein GY749_08870 [Desulfobacteraceae bacterium]|nr:hypothetical protein [Desulfobacteraceae bacterium]